MKLGRKMVLVDYDDAKNKCSEKNKNENVDILNHSSNNAVISQDNVTESLALSFLDREMTDILNQKNISDFDKWKLYKQRSLFYIRNKQQNEIDEAKKFNDALARTIKPNVVIQRSIIKQMKPRTIVTKRKINKNAIPVIVAKRVPDPILVSSDSDEYLTPTRSVDQMRKFRTRKSLGVVKKKRRTPSKTTEAIFSKWEQITKSE